MFKNKNNKTKLNDNLLTITTIIIITIVIIGLIDGDNVLHCSVKTKRKLEIFGR